MAVETAPEKDLEQKTTVDAGLIFLPSSLREMVSKGMEPKYSLISVEVRLVRELDKLNRQATGIKAVYTNGFLNFHVTEVENVIWGNDKISQRGGIWGFGARVEEGVLTYVEAQVSQGQLLAPRI